MKDSLIKRRVGYLYERQEATTESDAYLKEFDTYRCSHCDATVVKHPDRVRPREWCAGCDHHICDECFLLNRACIPLERRAELAFKYQDGLPYLSPYLPDGTVHPGVAQRLEDAKVHLLRS